MTAFSAVTTPEGRSALSGRVRFAMLSLTRVLSRATAVALALLCLPSCGGGGGSATPNPPNPNPGGGVQLGTVTVLSSGGCPSGVGSSVGCQLLQITATGLPSIEVELRRFDPPATTALRGTVLTSSGGIGADFLSGIAGGDTLVTEMTELGYRVYDRRWTSAWFEAGLSLKDQSIRYATLLDWVRTNLFDGTGVFGALGTSGGSAEIAYGLTTWESAALLDFAVLVSGPPMARLDYACPSATSAGWVTECQSLIPAGGLECGTPVCTGESQLVLCQALPANPAPGELEEASILHSAAVLDFGGLTLHMVLGENDCTVAVPNALLFASRVQSPMTTEFVTRSPHFLPSSEFGRNAVLARLAAIAPAGLRSASLSAPAFARVGRRLDLLVQTGARGVPFELRGLFADGALLSAVDTGLAPVVGAGTTDRFGRAVARLQLPADPALVGLTLHQCLVDGPAGGGLWRATRVVP